MIDSSTLSQQASQGDAQAIAQLLRNSEPDLRRFAARVCRSTADADDAVAHAMATLALNLATFRGLSRLSTWLYSIVRHECLKYERLARRWLFGVEASATDPHATPEQALSHAQLIDLIVNAVRGLPPELREVFILRELQQQSTEACAVQLGITPGNVKVRLHRARAQLREALASLR
jgi:RNA polymerase sigma factor (sigma-70 family)